MGDIVSLVTLGLRLILLLMEQVKEAKAEGVGYARATKDVLDQAHLDLAMADAERTEAEAQHKAHDDDTAFDPEFRRSD